MDCSICIPTYEMYGKGSEYLKQLLETILPQKDIKFQVVVSDQSTNEEIVNLCSDSRYKPLNIKLLKFNGKRHPCSNLNNAIKNADTRSIKIVFQDDFFIHDRALINCMIPIFQGKMWAATACAHTNDDGQTISRPFMPRYHDDIHLGVNTISSPSVISFKNENKIWFDENVVLFLDVDWYKCMANEYGEPYIIKTINVVNRVHPNSLSNTECSNTEETFKKELPYILNKHK